MTSHVTSSSSSSSTVPGAKFKEPPVEDEEKEAIESLLSSSARETVLPTQIVIQKPQPSQAYVDHVEKRRRFLGFRLDALLCTFAVTAVALVLVSILVALLLLRSPGIEEIPPKDDPQSVETLTSCGPVRGKMENGGYSFLGVPYAVPPTERLRFKKTIPLDKMVDCWEGVHDARRQRLPCYQAPIPGMDDVAFSEDCLYVDIYSPDISFVEPYPVVVYFRGESFMGHDKYSISMQPSARLARDTRTVFVSVNFRVHAFGFLTLKSLRTGHPSASGNYGLYDMVAALKWIQMNIESFGGDSRRVTLLGHGSIATAILSLVASPSTKGLYSVAWISGGSTNFVNTSMADAELANAEYFKKIHCKTLSCLTHEDPKKIVNAWDEAKVLDLPFANENFRATAVVDRHLIQDLPSRMFNRRQFNDVSIIIGATTYAVGDWSYLNSLNWTEVAEKAQIHLGTIDADLANDAVAQYLLKNEPVSLQYSKMIADSRIRCPLFHFARKIANKFVNSVYVYSSSFREGSQLRLDIAAILGQTEQFLGSELTNEDVNYAWRVRDVFYSFIRKHKLGSAQALPPPGFINFNGYGVETLNKLDLKCDFWIKSKIYPKYAKHD